MAQPYVGEIRQFGGNFAPNGWMFCNGQVLTIAENDVLFSLIGTTYGGDGVNTFALPNLQGRVPVHMGAGLALGQAGGAETVTLSGTQMPMHSHPVMAASSGGSDSPANAFWGASPTGIPYAAGPGSVTMNPASIGQQGSGQPHDNMQPFAAVSFIISLYGIYPSHS